MDLLYEVTIFASLIHEDVAIYSYCQLQCLIFTRSMS